MKKILIAYKVTSTGEKEFEVPDDFNTDDKNAMYKILEECDKVDLYIESEVDTMDCELVWYDSCEAIL